MISPKSYIVFLRLFSSLYNRSVSIKETKYNEKFCYMGNKSEPARKMKIKQEIS